MSKSPEKSRRAFYDCIWRQGLLQMGGTLFVSLLLLQVFRFGFQTRHVVVSLAAAWLGGLVFGWYRFWRTERQL